MSKPFMVQLHTLLYKYKKYATEIIEDANTCQRVALMKQADDLTLIGDTANSKKVMVEYDVVLKGEERDLEEFTILMQDTVFDYFNIIVKEYYMAVDKWGQDKDYVSAVKLEYEKIDKELEAQDDEEPLPEGLVKEIANQLLKEKEMLLTNIYTELSKMNQMEQAGGKFNFEQTVMLNKVMFEDKMYLKTGFSGKDLLRAIKRFGIADERMKEAKEIEDRE